MKRNRFFASVCGLRHAGESPAALRNWEEHLRPFIDCHRRSVWSAVLAAAVAMTVAETCVVARLGSAVESATRERVEGVLNFRGRAQW